MQKPTFTDRLRLATHVTATALLTATFAFIVSTAIAMAASEDAASPDTDEADEQSFVTRPEAYEQIVKAQDYIKKQQYEKATKVLEKMQRRLRLNNHEKSLVQQTFGFLYASQEKFPKAIEALNRCLELRALPKPTLLNIEYNLGQIYFATKKFKQAADTLEEWLKKSKNPAPSAIFTAAAANYQAHRYDRAAKYAQDAISRDKSKPDGWLQLLLASQMELKRFREASATLQTIVSRHPSRKTYWIQLASVYAQMNDDARALAVYELAYQKGVLNESSEIINLTQRMIQQGVPQKGAPILEGAIASGLVKPTQDNLTLLATAWQHARERDRAMEPLARAAQAAKDGSLFVRLAQIQLEKEDWTAAARSIERALKKGGLRHPGQAYLTLGIARFNAQKKKQAQQAFRQALADEDSKNAASGWLAFIEGASR
ncbi:MAG: tetratricopeptide repeat protein [Deltaproteobacteria bacterium]|nr:tetratricopeptide repeat protein [Deltaproteobacteria bacterium]